MASPVYETISPLHCHLKRCIQGALDAQMARVEVKAFEATAEDRRIMEVGWTESGDAVFHDICWKAIIG